LIKYDVKTPNGDNKTIEADEIAFTGGTLLVWRRDDAHLLKHLVAAWAPGTWMYVTERKP
jgi:hypothetical protein